MATCSTETAFIIIATRISARAIREAEGVDAFALADGRAGAVKIDDGAARGRVPVTVALLAELGAGHEPGADAAKLAALASTAVMGGERVVGEVRAAIPRAAAPPG